MVGRCWREFGETDVPSCLTGGDWSGGEMDGFGKQMKAGSAAQAVPEPEKLGLSSAQQPKLGIILHHRACFGTRTMYIIRIMQNP